MRDDHGRPPRLLSQMWHAERGLKPAPVSWRSFSENGGVGLRSGGTFVFVGAGGVASVGRCFVWFFFLSKPLLYKSVPSDNFMSCAIDPG